MDLYFLNFNNYYNRTIKFYSSINGYQQNGEFLGEPLLGCSFNPNDSTDTIHVVNRAQEEIGDYMLAVLGNEIISRWFILEARRERTGQYTLRLRRDMFSDSYNQVIQAPAFIEKATLNNGDPMIFNSEDMTFNQIKTSETPLKDETNSAWVVGYIPRDSFSESKTISGNVTIDNAFDIEVTSLANWDNYNYIGTPFKSFYILSETWFAGYTRVNLMSGLSVKQYMQGFAINGNGESANVNGYTGNDSTNGTVPGIQSPALSLDQLVYVSNSSTPGVEEANQIKEVAINGWKDDIPSGNWHLDDLKRYSLSYTQCNDSASSFRYLNLENKIIFESSTGLYHRVVLKKEKKSATLNITTGNLFQHMSNTFTRQINNIGDIIGTPGADSFKMYYSYYEYTMSLEQIFVTATVDIDANRYHLEDQPYDMFCIPYSDTLEIYKNGTKLFNANKSIAINMAIEIGADAGTNSIYDVQLLPYCPVRYCIKADGTFDIGDARVHYIKSGENNIGVVLWATSSAFTINIPHTINVVNPKIESQTDIYRLCSPNFNGQFEFSPAMNGGVEFFNVDCNYKPYNPYIHINPNFSSLYGQDFNDARGLICGGDFSLPQLSNAWANYQLNNKNYQNIFDRQIENMEVNNAIQRRKETLGVTLGTIGGMAGGAMVGSKGGVAGIAAGAVVGGMGSAIAGGMDMMFNEMQRIEALDYTKDQFGYQLGNIQALPTSLSKTSAFTYNNKIFPILEYYTCTEEEKRALENKLKYNGMTVMRIGTIQEFIQENPTYIKGKLIRLENTGEDFHYVSELAKEFDKGVFI